MTGLVSVRSEEPSPGERYLVVSAVDARTGEETREARVKVYPAGLPPGTIDRLADFLATGTAAPPIEALRGQVVADPPKAEAAEPPKQVAVDAPKQVELAPAQVTTEPAVVAAPVARPSRAPVYVAAGAGVASLLAGGFFHLQAQADDRALVELRAEGEYVDGSEQRVRELTASLGRNQTTAAVLAASGGAALLTAGFLYFIGAEPSP